MASADDSGSRGNKKLSSSAKLNTLNVQFKAGRSKRLVNQKQETVRSRHITRPRSSDISTSAAPLQIDFLLKPCTLISFSCICLQFQLLCRELMTMVSTKDCRVNRPI